MAFAGGRHLGSWRGLLGDLTWFRPGRGRRSAAPLRGGGCERRRRCGAV